MAVASPVAAAGAHRQKPGKFELADRGTIFLDEIGEMPLPLQAKLESRAAPPPTPNDGRWSCVIALCATWATVDEAHQTAVPSRRGSAWDVALDTAGATVALATTTALRRRPWAR